MGCRNQMAHATVRSTSPYADQSPSIFRVLSDTPMAITPPSALANATIGTANAFGSILNALAIKCLIFLTSCYFLYGHIMALTIQTSFIFILLWSAISSAAIIGSSSGISYRLAVLSCRNILLSVYASDFNASSLLTGLNSHSQMVTECQPISASSCWTFKSRSLFRFTLLTQNSVLVLGMV